MTTTTALHMLLGENIGLRSAVSIGIYQVGESVYHFEIKLSRPFKHLAEPKIFIMVFSNVIRKSLKRYRFIPSWIY